METQTEKDNLRRAARDQRRLWRSVLYWLIALVVIGGVVFGLIKIAGKERPADPASNLSVPVSASDWRTGPVDAKVVIVEYADFQCPACGLYYPLLKKVLVNFPDDVAVVYRHFPLAQHPHAKLAAYAAEAAGQQGKFWEMSDLIFSNQLSWSNQLSAKGTFLGYARSLGLNMTQFENDLDSATIKSQVTADYESGLSSGVNSTPSFFLNGKKITNPSTEDEFKNLILDNLSA